MPGPCFSFLDQCLAPHWTQVLQVLGKPVEKMLHKVLNTPAVRGDKRVSALSRRNPEDQHLTERPTVEEKPLCCQELNGPQLQASDSAQVFYRDTPLSHELNLRGSRSFWPKPQPGSQSPVYWGAEGTPQKSCLRHQWIALSFMRSPWYWKLNCVHLKKDNVGILTPSTSECDPVWR